jgi:hypothetical protein
MPNLPLRNHHNYKLHWHGVFGVRQHVYTRAVHFQDLKPFFYNYVNDKMILERFLFNMYTVNYSIVHYDRVIVIRQLAATTY